MMDFHGMKRRKLQLLCKKHGIPANLKNIEMANRLTSLFTDQTSPVRTQTMSDILSRCSVIESQRDGASADDEALVTSEYNTENSTVEEEEEMEISEERCMSVGHRVSNPEFQLGMPTEMELLSAKRHGDLSEYNNTHESSSVDLHDEPNVAASSLRRSSVGDFNGNEAEGNEENKTVEIHCESGTITSPNRRSLLGSFVSENSGGNKAMELHEEESVVFIGMVERREFLGEGEVKKPAQCNEEVGLSSEMHKAAVESPDESDVPGRHPFPEASDLEEAAKSEENKALEVDCGANKSAKSHDVVTASEPDTDGKQGLEEVESKDESAFFTRFETGLLLGESTQDRPGYSKSGSSHHDSSAKVILKDNSVVWGSHISALDLGNNTTADSSGGSHESNAVEETAGACLNATQGTLKQSKVNSPHVDSVIDTIMECNPESELFVEKTPSPSLVQLALSLPTCPILVKETVSTLIAEEDYKNNEEIVLKEHRFVAKLADAEAVLENSDVFTTPERNLMMMEQLIQNGKTLASESVNHQSDEAVEYSYALVFTTPEQVLLLGDSVLDEVGKQVDSDNITGAYIAAKSHDISDVLSASESQSIMGDFGPHISGNQEREEVEFKEESAAFFTWFETCLLLGESARDIFGNNKSGSTPHDSSAKVIVNDDSMVRGSHVPVLDLGDNTVAVSSGSITSKVSYSHEFNAGEETAGACLDAAQRPTKQSKRDSPHVDSANPFDLDIDGADTTMDAEINVSFSSYVLAGTCSLVPEEFSSSTNIHDQINDALEELAIADELIETKVTTQKDDKGMLDSSGGSSA